MKFLFLICGSFLFSGLYAQTNIIITNPDAEEVIKGNFDPSLYFQQAPVSDKYSIVSGINSGINPDSLHAYMVTMGGFINRNTGSDTASLVKGIGATRKWAYNKFLSFSSASEDRLLVSYLQFDEAICSITQHRNIFAVLPGSDTTDHAVIIIEGHIDSRCDVPCDTSCLAEGMEDNATGSALVLELARVMSKYTYRHTIVFMLTIGEEQGLYGANAFSQYAVNNSIPIKAVYNNDVVGGIICGQTSSAPSCPGLNDIDSTNVRFFSFGGNNSKHKQFARFNKLEYQEELLPIVSVPMGIHIMTGEDRVGRGGDHIPFRQDGFTAMRTTSANEHGDASNGPGYTDRQHTSDDILGVDTNGDLIIDSFYVDFNYLKRNTVINGVGAAMAAIGPKVPSYQITSSTDSSLTITITDQTQHPQYRVALRTNTNDWDTVYTLNGTVGTVEIPTALFYYISAASVDSSGVESFFTNETYLLEPWLEIPETEKITDHYELLQNKPNPFDESTMISVYVPDSQYYGRGTIVIRDLQGKIIEELSIDLDSEINDVEYTHGYGMQGVYSYTLVVNGVEIATKRMVFAN